MKRFGFSNFTRWISANDLRQQIIKGGGKSLFIQVGFAALSYVTATILARFLGAGSYGAYTNAQSWTNVLIPIAGMGFGSLLIKNSSVFRIKNRWGEFLGLVKYADRVVILGSLILILMIFSGSFFIYPHPSDFEIRSTLWVGLLLVPLEALLILRQGTLRGLEHVARSLMPEQTIRPTLLLIGVVVFYLIAPQFLTPQTAMAVSVTAGLAGLIIASYWQKRLSPSEASLSTPVFRKREWLVTAFPMMISSSLNLMLSQTSPIMLGIMAESEAVGFYSAAFKIAYLVIFLPQAVGYVIAPIIARMFANGEKVKLQKLLTSSVRITFFCGLAMSILLAAGSKFLLSLFGQEFISAFTTLLVLLLSNLLGMAIGMSSLILNMTGHQNTVATVYGIFCAVNIALNFLLIPVFGFLGAALAYSITTFVYQIILTIYTRVKTGLNPSII